MALLVLALLLATAAVARGEEPAADLAAVLAEGDAHHDAFDYEAARDAYERGLALQPGGSEAAIRLVHVLNDLGETRRAEAAAARGTGDDERGRHHDAEAEALFDRARDLAGELRDGWPERPEGHYWYAASLANLTPFRPGSEKVRFAREIDAAARQAILLDPCFAPAWAVLGIASREIAGVGWFVRGMARAALGGLPRASLDEAEGLLRAAVALDPENPFPLYELALTLEARDRPREAVEAFARSLALPPREARDLRNRVDAKERLRRLGRVVSRRDERSP